MHIKQKSVLRLCCNNSAFVLLVFTQHATGYSKLEKADILELAVKYLRNVRGQQISGIVTSSIMFIYHT